VESDRTHHAVVVKKMEYVATAIDKVLISYNDRPLPEISPAAFAAYQARVASGESDERDEDYLESDLRWDFRRAGYKTPKGYAPVYVYDQEAEVLTALVADPPDLPYDIRHSIKAVAANAAVTTEPWSLRKSPPITAEEVARAVEFAKVAAAKNEQVAFFTKSHATLLAVVNAMVAADIRVASLRLHWNSATQRVIDAFNAKDSPITALVLTDAFATGISLANVTSVVHLDIPANALATVLQRNARADVIRRFPKRAQVFTVSTTLEERLNTLLASRHNALEPFS
jgi:hypothetical protein